MKVLAVTCNVGSVCEAPEHLPRWIEQLRVLLSASPHLVVLHLQELGGQSKSLDGIAQLSECLKDLLDPELYWSTGLLYDGDLERGSFTALGSCVFALKSLSLQLLCFRGGLGKFHSPAQVLSRSEAARFSMYAQHEKFAGDQMNPSGGRKGFLRLCLGCRGRAVLDVVNVHCVADTSNLEALRGRSKFAECRLNSLRYACDQTGALSARAPPALLFGDANMRLDLKRLADDVGHDALHVEKKVFRSERVHAMALDEEGLSLLGYDAELAQLDGLHECDISFRPTYCLVEGSEWMYAEKRCPAYCDRIFFNEAASEAGARAGLYGSLAQRVQYSGQTFCDHSAVYLDFELAWPDEDPQVLAVPSFERPVITFENVVGIIAICSVAFVLWTWYTADKE